MAKDQDSSRMGKMYLSIGFGPQEACDYKNNEKMRYFAKFWISNVSYIRQDAGNSFDTALTIHGLADKQRQETGIAAPEACLAAK